MTSYIFSEWALENMYDVTVLLALCSQPQSSPNHPSAIVPHRVHPFNFFTPSRPRNSPINIGCGATPQL